MCAVYLASYLSPEWLKLEIPIILFKPLWTFKVVETALEHISALLRVSKWQFNFYKNFPKSPKKSIQLVYLNWVLWANKMG